MTVSEDTFSRLRAVIGSVLKSAPTALTKDALLVDSGLDSLSLLVLREECEKSFNVSIPDSDWLSMSTVAELTDLIERLGTSIQPAAGVRQWDADDMEEIVEIGMPLLGVGNLCESALLKHLGDVRWRHITRLTGVPSRSLLDDEGNRLYPAFFYVEVRFPESRPMGSFGENDTLRVMDTVKRYGFSMLDGTAFLIPSDVRQGVSEPLEGVATVRMSNAFVMKFDGAEWLKKSRPKSGILDPIAELSAPPDSYELTKLAQQGGSLGAPEPGSKAVHEADVTYEYTVQPDRDVNGVGLLYFANYPLFLDLAERDALKRAAPCFSDALINTRSLVTRKIVYLNNAAWRDSLRIQTRSWVRKSAEGPRLCSEQRMFRQSDARIMCACWSDKVVSDPSQQLQGWIDQRRA